MEFDKKFCYMKKNNINKQCYYIDAINDLDTVENLKDLNISVKDSDLKNSFLIKLIVCNNKIKEVIPQKELKKMFLDLNKSKKD